MSFYLFFCQINININDIKARYKELKSSHLYLFDSWQQGCGTVDPIKTVMKSEKDGNHNPTSYQSIFSPATEIEDFVNFLIYLKGETGTCLDARRMKRSLKRTKKSPRHSSLIIWRMLQSRFCPYCQRLPSSLFVLLL